MAAPRDQQRRRLFSERVDRPHAARAVSGTVQEIVDDQQGSQSRVQTAHAAVPHHRAVGTYWYVSIIIYYNDIHRIYI